MNPAEPKQWRKNASDKNKQKEDNKREWQKLASMIPQITFSIFNAE